MAQIMIDAIGGEPRLRKLVNDFYDLVKTIPQGQNIENLQARGHGLDHLRQE